VVSTSKKESSASQGEASSNLAVQREALRQLLRAVPPTVPPTAPWAQREWQLHGACSGRVQQQSAVCDKVPAGTDVQSVAHKFEVKQEGKEPLVQTKMKRSLKIRNTKLLREELKELNAASHVNSARPSSKGGAEESDCLGASPRGEASRTSRSDESTRATDSDDESEASKGARSKCRCPTQQGPKQLKVWLATVAARTPATIKLGRRVGSAPPTIRRGRRHAGRGLKGDGRRLHPEATLG